MAEAVLDDMERVLDHGAHLRERPLDRFRQFPQGLWQRLDDAAPDRDVPRPANDEHASGLGDIRAVLLGRVQGLFLSVTLWARRNRCTVLSPTVIPHETASAPRISCKVKSGCRATSCSTLARCSPNRERRSPPIARGRAWPSARQRCAQRVALLTLTSNRVAAARALPPSAMKPITRSLRSCEYGAGISPPMASSRRSLANQQGPENPFFT